MQVPGIGGKLHSGSSSLGILLSVSITRTRTLHDWYQTLRRESWSWHPTLDAYRARTRATDSVTGSTPSGIVLCHRELFLSNIVKSNLRDHYKSLTKPMFSPTPEHLKWRWCHCVFRGTFFSNKMKVFILDTLTKTLFHIILFYIEFEHLMLFLIYNQKSEYINTCFYFSERRTICTKKLILTRCAFIFWIF